ncbi:MAG: hypothetical protein R2713_10605 [Ilumatobacteraceae bacterium]
MVQDSRSPARHVAADTEGLPSTPTVPGRSLDSCWKRRSQAARRPIMTPCAPPHPLDLGADTLFVEGATGDGC